MSSVFGIDISEYQAGINFSKLVAEGVKFVILRGGDGAYNDKQFATFYQKAKDCGVFVGAYWFSRAISESQAQAEAEHFYKSCLYGRQFELPIYIDVECTAQGNLSTSALTAIIKAWCQRMEDLGIYPGVYASASWFDTQFNASALTQYAFWIAKWSAVQPYQSHGMWQFGGESNYLRDKHIAGMVVDQNYMRTDYPNIIKKAGLNGYGGEQELTQEDMVKLLTEYRQTLRDNDAGSWSEDARKFAVDNGIINGIGTNPDGSVNYAWGDFVSREQMSAIAQRVATVSAAAAKAEVLDALIAALKKQ